MTPYRISEAQTRHNHIDPQLKKAEWNFSDLTQVAFEIPVTGYDATFSEGYSEYCLYNTSLQKQKPLQLSEGRCPRTLRSLDRLGTGILRASACMTGLFDMDRTRKTQLLRTSAEEIADIL